MKKIRNNVFKQLRGYDGMKIITSDNKIRVRRHKVGDYHDSLEFRLGKNIFVKVCVYWDHDCEYMNDPDTGRLSCSTEIIEAEFFRKAPVYRPEHWRREQEDNIKISSTSEENFLQYFAEEMAKYL